MSDLDTTEEMFGAQRYVDELLQSVGYGRPDDQEKLRTQLAAAAERDKAMAGKIRRLFSTKAGDEVLGWLIDNTKRKDWANEEMILTLDSDRLLAFSMFRAGQNSVVDTILDAMAQSSGKKRKKRTPT